VNVADRWILGTATAVVVAGLAWGAISASDAAGSPSRGPRFVRATGGATKVDPFNPPGLPKGVTIDPTTGRMLGLKVDAPPGTTPVAWETLKGYEYREGLEALPEEIKRLDGQKVVMAGVLMPLYEWDDIHEFVLVESHWSCCYGSPPGLNGVVYVKLKAGADGLPNTAEPLRVVGTFRAAERKESGFMLAIYAIVDSEVTVLGY
jgi:hypothetical protein